MGEVINNGTQNSWCGRIKYKATTYSYERLGYIFDTMDYLLAQINFPMVYEWSSNKVSGSTNIKDALINIFVLEQDDKSCFEVLELLLKSFALQMRYVGGNKYQKIGRASCRERVSSPV